MQRKKAEEAAKNALITKMTSSSLASATSSLMLQNVTKS